MDGQHQRASKPSAALNQPPDTNGFEYCFRLIELELTDREGRTVRRAAARAEQNQATTEIVDPDTGEITTF
jgi:hypothetical protein